MKTPANKGKASKCPLLDQGSKIGSAVVGERGQIVIPKEIRDQFNLRTGSQLMVMQHKGGPIILLPVAGMKTFIAQMSKRVASLTQALKNNA